MHSPFTDAAVPTPGASGNHEGTRGGFDITDGRKETSGGDIPDLPTITTIDGQGAGTIEGGDAILGRIQSLEITRAKR